MMAMGLYRTLGWCNVCGPRIVCTESLLTKSDNIRTIIVNIEIIINCGKGIKIDLLGKYVNFGSTNLVVRLFVTIICQRYNNGR